MRDILAAVAFLQALITGADCLHCEKCFATGTSQCSGVSKQCAPGVTHCIKGLENDTQGTHVYLTAFKDCLEPFQKSTCGREFFIKNSVVSFQTSRTCCDSDSCNKGDVEVPAVDNTPNGYTCKECFTNQSTTPCTASGDFQCIGEHDTCASYSGTAARPGEALSEYSLKACASKDFCKLFPFFGTQAYIFDLLCSPAEKL